VSRGSWAPTGWVRLGLFGALIASCGPEPSAEDASQREARGVDPIGSGALALADDLGLPPRFNRGFVLADPFFIARDAVTPDALQALFESTPYGGRSWLADERIDSRRASDAIVDSAQSAGLNPLVVLARMQVESSLVARSSRPSQMEIDYALGCGCPDGSRCDPAYRGLDKQVACASATLLRWYRASIDGEGEWRAGIAHRTSDGIRVTPENDATASLYAYTPWVLEGRGGNWLVWNVTRKLAAGLADRGSLAYPSGGTATGIEIAWTADKNLSYTFTARPPDQVTRVEYWAEGSRIGAAERSGGGDFTVAFRFSRPVTALFVEARGFDDSGSEIAFSLALLDITSGMGLYVRPIDRGTFEVGLERAPSSVASIRVDVDGVEISDDVSGEVRSTRLAVTHRYDLGLRSFAIAAFDADGTPRGMFHRSFRLR
jgi:hypothetical protein